MDKEVSFKLLVKSFATYLVPSPFWDVCPVIPHKESEAYYTQVALTDED